MLNKQSAEMENISSGGFEALKRSRSLSFLRLFSRRNGAEAHDSTYPLQQQKSQLLDGRNKRRPSGASNPNTKVLPQEIHDNILRFLRATHENGTESTCSTCLSRDLSAYSLVCKSWDTAVIPHMYQKIWINGAEAPIPKKSKRKQREAGRVSALLRTLESRPDFAFHVRELKLPEYNRVNTPRVEVEHFVNTAAAIVRCCVNLEKFVGPYTNVGGGWSSTLNKALSGCVSLQEHVLMFDEETGTGRSKLERSREFAQLHEKWANLETLVLHGCGQEPEVDFVGAFVNLPNLKNLMISNFRLGESAALALQAIPASVESLRLENLQGLTGRHLNGFAVSRKTRGLKSLALINITLPRLQDIIAVFRLPNLTSFTIADALDMPYFDETELSNDMIPQVSSTIFTSPTLQHLHWDILVHPFVETALANSISTGKLPALRTLRAPSDRHGTLQAVCRPLANISLASDFIYEAPSSTTHNHLSPALSRPPSNKSNFLSPSPSPSTIHSRRSSISSSHSAMAPGPSVAVMKAFGKTKPEFQPFPRTLPSARIRAQKRLDRAKQDISLQITISEEGVTKETIILRGYMGDVKSNVVYTLASDLTTEGATDISLGQKGRDWALISFEKDVLEGPWKREMDVGSGIGKEVCNGGWSAKNQGVGRKERKNSLKASLHTERKRIEYGRVELKRLFWT